MIEIINAQIQSINIGNKHSDYRGYFITFNLIGDGFGQSFSLVLNLENLISLVDLFDGELFDCRNQYVRIAKENGLIISIGHIMKDSWVPRLKVE